MSSIVLPWPPSALSSNARGHWAKKARATAKYRNDARLCAIAAKVRAPAEGKIALTIRFVPPHGRYDEANLPAMFKAGIDGIADALATNDKRFAPTFEFSPPAKPGQVIVTLEDA